MRLFLALAAALLLAAGVSSAAWAGEDTVGGALVEVLHNKGVLDDASYNDLKNAGTEGGEQAVNRKLIEVLHSKGVLDDASYNRLSGMAAREAERPAPAVAASVAPKPMAEAKPAETTARQEIKPVDKALTAVEEGIARLSGDTVKMKIGLFFQGGWLNDDAGFSVQSPPATGRSTTSGNQFFVRRARFFFDGALSDKLGFRVSLETTDANGKPLRDAYFYTDYIPYARITLGQQKVPFGVEGVESLALNPTINRSFVTNHVHAITGSLTTLRDLGVTASGKYQTKLAGLPFGAGYAMGVFNGTGQNTTDDNDAKDFAGRAWVNPLVQGLTVGGSWYTGRTHHGTTPDFNKDHDKWAADLDYTPDMIKGLKLRGEVMWERRYFDTYASKNITDTSSLPALGRHAHTFGWYALAAYRVDGLQGYWRYLNGFEPVFRYDVLDEDTTLPDDSRDRTTIGLNYYIGKNARLMANYEIIHADGSLGTKSLETIDTIGHHLFTAIAQFKF